MKIAHLMPQFFSGMGGLQVCVHNISQLHTEKGASVTVFHCDNRAPDFQASYQLEKIIQFRLLTKLYPFSKWLLNLYFTRLQQKYGFDLWQINGGYPYGAMLADFFRSHSIPCVLRCSGDDIQSSEAYQYGVRRNPKINQIITENYRHYHGAVAITNTVKQEYLKLGLTEERIHPIPNGVDLARIDSFLGQNQGQVIRQRHNIPEDALLILTVGRNHPKKNYQAIPDILANLLRAGKNAYWLIVGKGSRDVASVGASASEGRLIYVDELNMQSSRDSLPPDALLEYYMGADLFAMTSMLETFGIVLVEAMACGLPVVSFDVPGVSDVMHSQCGVLCRAGDNNGFAEALAGFDDEEKRRAVGKQARIYASQYAWPALADSYYDLYESLLPKRGIPGIA